MPVPALAEEHRAARGKSTAPAGAAKNKISESKIEPSFAQLCALVRGERALFEAEFLEHLKTRCARLGWRCSGELLDKAIQAVAIADRRSSGRAATRSTEPVARSWRDDCPHTPTCATPTRCAVRKETGR